VSVSFHQFPRQNSVFASCFSLQATSHLLHSTAKRALEVNTDDVSQSKSAFVIAEKQEILCVSKMCYVFEASLHDVGFNKPCRQSWPLICVSYPLHEYVETMSDVHSTHVEHARINFCFKPRHCVSLNDFLETLMAVCN
jgi:hypothetical protein